MAEPGQLPEQPAGGVETPSGTLQQPVEEHGNDVLGFDGQMVLLTWVAFLIAAVLLGKLLWKPILNVLEAREAEIKNSLDDAAKARKAAQDADALASQTLANAEKEARVQADALISATQARIETLEQETHTALAQKRKVAEERLAVEREDALKRLREQAGDEIAAALEQILPGLLTDEQRKAYQERIAAEVRF